MAKILKLNSWAWRAQIRLKVQYASSTFRAHADAERWARDIECKIDLCQTIGAPMGPQPVTLADSIKLHITDMCEVGRAPRGSKAYCLDKLTSPRGRIKLTALIREGLSGGAKNRSATST